MWSKLNSHTTLHIVGRSVNGSVILKNEHFLSKITEHLTYDPMILGICSREVKICVHSLLVSVVRDSALRLRVVGLILVKGVCLCCRLDPALVRACAGGNLLTCLSHIMFLCLCLHPPPYHSLSKKNKQTQTPPKKQTKNQWGNILG